MIIKLNESAFEDVGLKIEQCASQVLDELELDMLNCHRDLNVRYTFRQKLEDLLYSRGISVAFETVITPNGFKVGGNPIGISWDMMYALFDRYYQKIELTPEQLQARLSDKDIRCFETRQHNVRRVRPEMLLNTIPGTETRHQGIGSAASIKEYTTEVRIDPEGDIWVDSYVLTWD